jgi:hypothetical protein
MVRRATSVKNKDGVNEEANLNVEDLPKLGKNEDATNLVIKMDLAWQE